MKKQILAILCVFTLIVALMPDSFAAESDSAGPKFELADTQNEIKSRRVGELEENRRIMDANHTDRSVLYVENFACNGTSVQDMAIAEHNNLIEYFRSATESLQEEIDISGFKIKYNEKTDTVDIDGGIPYGKFYEMLVYCAPRSYYLISENGTFDYFYPVVENDIILYIYPIYSYFKNDSLYDEDLWINQDRLAELLPEIKDNMAVFDSGINEIKSIIDENNSDFEKLVKYHDYIVMNYSYDWESSDKPVYERENNITLKLLANKKGLCGSIAMLFNYLAMDMGLDTGFVTSYNIENEHAYHTWNMVKVALPEYGVTEEEWFHIDVTWDENATEYVENGRYIKEMGKTSFENFLTSDKKTWGTHGADAVAGTYYNPDCGAVTELLDNAAWRKATSRLAVHNDTLYYLTDNNGKTELCGMNESGSSEVLESFDNNWAARGSYSGLVMKDDIIYYNTSNKILAYDTVNKTIISTDIALSDTEQLFVLYPKEEGIGYCTAELNGYGVISPININGTINTECTVLNPVLSDSTITIPINSDLNKDFFVIVKAGNSYRAVSAVTNKDIILDDIPESGITVYVWNSRMQPYINPVNI